MKREVLARVSQTTNAKKQLIGNKFRNCREHHSIAVSK